MYVDRSFVSSAIHRACCMLFGKPKKNGCRAEHRVPGLSSYRGRPKPKVHLKFELSETLLNDQDGCLGTAVVASRASKTKIFS